MYSALIVAAGSSTRMNGIDKILMPINGIPVIVRTCSAFQENKNISDIVVVASENNILKIKSLLPKDKFTKLKSIVNTLEEFFREPKEERTKLFLSKVL